MLYLAQWTQAGEKTREHDMALIEMICVDGMPISTCERPGFKHFMKIVAPQYRIRFEL